MIGQIIDQFSLGEWIVFGIISGTITGLVIGKKIWGRIT